MPHICTHQTAPWVRSWTPLCTTKQANQFSLLASSNQWQVRRKTSEKNQNNQTEKVQRSLMSHHRQQTDSRWLRSYPPSVIMFELYLITALYNFIIVVPQDCRLRSTISNAFQTVLSAWFDIHCALQWLDEHWHLNGCRSRSVFRADGGCEGQKASFWQIWLSLATGQFQNNTLFCALSVGHFYHNRLTMHRDLLGLLLRSSIIILYWTHVHTAVRKVHSWNTQCCYVGILVPGKEICFCSTFTVKMHL